MVSWRIALACFCCFVGSGRSPAGDWPEFRGAMAQGHYQGKPLPLTWTATKNVTWQKRIPGLGWSSPAVVDGRVYLTTAVAKGADHSLRAMALDAKTGTIIWDQEVFLQDGSTGPKIHNKNSHASASPVVRDGKLFVHFGHQGTACLDLDGKVIWRNREMRYLPVHGNGGSPILVGDLLIFSCDGASDPFVAALDVKDGQVRWKTPRSWESFKKFAFCTPILITVDGKEQVVSAGAGGVAGYDPKDGREIWKVHYEGYSVVPRPVFGHGMIYLSTGYDTPSLLAIRVDGRGDVTESHVAWTLRRSVPRNASPILVGNELYIVSDDGRASCVDAKTGKVHWNETLGGAYSSSPLLANGRIYFLSEEGLTTVVKASKTFAIEAKNDLKERTQASMAAVDGAIYLRTANALYRIEKK